MLRSIKFKANLSNRLKATLTLEWIPLVLSQITSLQMREVAFDLTVDAAGILEVMPWSELANIFSRPPFLHLESVVFKFTGDVNRGAVTSLVGSMLPGQRDILVLSWPEKN